MCRESRRAHMMLSPKPIALLPLIDRYLPLAARQSGDTTTFLTTGPTQKERPPITRKVLGVAAVARTMSSLASCHQHRSATGRFGGLVHGHPRSSARGRDARSPGHAWYATCASSGTARTRTFSPTVWMFRLHPQQEQGPGGAPSRVRSRNLGTPASAASWAGSPPVLATVLHR